MLKIKKKLEKRDNERLKNTLKLKKEKMDAMPKKKEKLAS